MSHALACLIAFAYSVPAAMTPRAAGILLHLRSLAASGETDSFQGIAAATGLSSPSLSRALDTLSASGLVLRQPRPKRSRNPLYISLTSDGYRVAGRIESAFAAVPA